MKIAPGLSCRLGLPLVRAELERNSRRLRTHLARWLYLLALCVGAALFWIGLHEDQPGVSRVSPMVQGIFCAFAWIQLLVLFLSAAHAASQSLVEERNRDTLTVLLSTPLSSFSILAGKWLSVMTRVLLHALATLPLFALLLSEGGLTPQQVGSIFLLTLAFVGATTAIALFGATFERNKNPGFGLAVALPILYAVSMSVLETLLSGFLQNELAKWVALPIVPTEWWHRLNFFKAFLFTSIGEGTFFQAPTWYEGLGGVLLALMVQSMLITTLLLATGAVLLRPMARLGKMSLLKALWLSMVPSTAAVAPARRAWEQLPIRPWLSLPLGWRAIAVAASPSQRRRQRAFVFGCLLLLLFGPIILFLIESTITYARYAHETYEQHGVLPPPHSDFVFSCGYLTYSPSEQATICHPHRYHRDSIEALQHWLQFCSGFAAFLLPLVISNATAAAGARESDTKRLSLLLASPLPDRQIGLGLICEGLAPSLGAVLAVLAAAAVGTVTGLLPVLGTLSGLLYLAAVGSLYCALGLRIGLSSSSTKSAQARIGGVWLVTALLYPLVVSIACGLLRQGEEMTLALTSLSPPVLAVTSMVSFGSILDHDDSELASAFLIGTAGLLTYGLAGCWLLATTCSRVRHLVRSKA